MDSISKGDGPPWHLVLRIWWSFVWRAAIAGSLAALITSAVVGATLGLIGRRELIGSLATPVAVATALAATVWALRASLIISQKLIAKAYIDNAQAMSSSLIPADSEKDTIMSPE
jgi:hypothetical protein